MEARRLLQRLKRTDSFSFRPSLPICSAVRLDAPLGCRRDYQALHSGRSVCLRLGSRPGLCVRVCAIEASGCVRFATSRWWVRRQDPHGVPMPSGCVALSPSEITRSVTHAGLDIQTPPANTTHAASVACCESLPLHGPTLSEPPTCGASVGGQSSATRAPPSSATSMSTSRSARTTSPNFENVKPSRSVPSAPRRTPESSAYVGNDTASRTVASNPSGTSAEESMIAAQSATAGVADAASDESQEVPHTTVSALAAERIKRRRAPHRSDASQQPLRETKRVPGSNRIGRTPAIASGMRAHCLAVTPAASLRLERREGAAPQSGRSAARAHALRSDYGAHIMSGSTAATGTQV